VCTGVTHRAVLRDLCTRKCRKVDLVHVGGDVAAYGQRAATLLLRQLPGVAQRGGLLADGYGGGTPTIARPSSSTFPQPYAPPRMHRNLLLEVAADLTALHIWPKWYRVLSSTDGPSGIHSTMMRSPRHGIIHTFPVTMSVTYRRRRFRS
jgi:hypothetical protein